MKPHSHIIPMGSSERWPYRVYHFDGNGNWCASSLHETKEEARKAQRKAMRRYRRERKVGKPGEIKT
jgi:hypothetical protein